MNCHFLYGVDTSKKKRKETTVEYVDHSNDNKEWEMDESHKEHLKELGLYDDEKPGEEYISRL